VVENNFLTHCILDAEYTEAADVPPTLQKVASHSRSFSYDQMQQMGLSKAIDEYHRLLETGAQINTPRVPGKSGRNSNFFSTLLQATVIRPLPMIFRPETLIACISALWYIASFVIYYSAPITVPLVVWLALAPATPLHVPAQLAKAYPALKDVQFQPPADWKIRCALALAALMALRAAESAVAARSISRRQAAEAAITPERLEAFYSGYSMAGTGRNIATAAQDWQGVVKAVSNLSQVYEDAPRPVETRADALAWLERVAKEVGLTISREAHHGADAALKAVEQVRRMLVA
jgi:hypothetical protein